MAIVSSKIISRIAQKIGSYITERHTDQFGKHYDYEYLNSGQDENAIMAARALKITEALKEWEINDFINNGWSGLQYQTADEFATAIRIKYKNANGIEAAQIAKAILDAINSGQVTDAQVQNAFGLTQAQYTNNKAKLQTVMDDYDAVIAVMGA